MVAALAEPAAAQQDTLRRPVPARIDTLLVDSSRLDTVPAVPVVVQSAEPSRPISPGGAFLQSLLIPGRGQITMGKKNASRFYIAVELLGIGMTIKSYGDLREAKRHEGDSTAVEWDVDPVTGDSTPTRFEPSRFTPELTNARRTHVEDWIALLIFNHLLSAADAYVAANLWDFPAKVTVRARPPGAYARTSDRSVPPSLNLEARVTGTITW
ncbi:MAG: hypothetical protein ACSLFE_05870 [Gemmatimonadaceae bacterium]